MTSLLQQRQDLIEKGLENLYSQFDSYIDSTKLSKALNHTLLAGGKRIRPVLSLTFASLAANIRGLEYKETALLPLAFALEMVHTYSLIHDDLPALDNDSLRRGKPTCHIAFDEATAILTGDALLSDAFAQLAKLPFPAENLVSAIKYFSHSIGSQGMVGGQMLDLYMEEKKLEVDGDILPLLAFMNSRKTGDLLKAACILPCLLYGVQKQALVFVENFATSFGLAFQITDDVLDYEGNTKEMGKSQGKDKRAHKCTWVTCLGIDTAKNKAKEHIFTAKQALTSLLTFVDEENKDIESLVFLVDSLYNRKV